MGWGPRGCGVHLRSLSDLIRVGVGRRAEYRGPPASFDFAANPWEGVLATVARSRAARSGRSVEEDRAGGSGMEGAGTLTPACLFSEGGTVA